MKRLWFAIREAVYLFIWYGTGDAWTAAVKAYDFGGRVKTWRAVCAPDFDEDAPVMLMPTHAAIDREADPAQRATLQAWRDLAMHSEE